MKLSAVKICTSLSVFLFLLSLAYGMGLKTHAQNYDLSELPGSDPISTQVSPQYPQPGQKVTVSLTSYTVDLDRATITWFLNGKQQTSGIAISQFSFSAGKSGTVQTVDVSIVSATGASITKTVTINPGTVDILWQSNSYVPPFYKGKALYPPQGDVTFVAMPHIIQGGREVDAQKLIYKWKNNGDALNEQSGYGKSTITIKGSFGSEPLRVSVTASTVDGSGVGVGSLSIAPQSPVVLLYENSQLYGPIYTRALAPELSLKAQELSIRAIPYYFSTAPTVNNNLNFGWAINGNQVSDVAGDTITLRQPNGQSGSSVITLQIDNPAKIFQSQNKQISIYFNGQ